MPDWGLYFSQQLQSFLISLASTILCNWAILRCVFFARRVRIGAIRLLLGNLIISLCCILPHYLAYFFLYPDGSVIALVYNLLLFANPLYIFPYCLIFRHLFKLSKGVALLSLEPFILTQSASLLTFSFFSNIWTSIVEASYFSVIFPPDLLAMTCTDALFLLIMLLYKRLTARPGRSVFLAFAYSDKLPERGLLYSLLSISSTYAILVSVSTLLMKQYRVNISLRHAWLYFLLILIVIYRIFDNYHRQRINMMQCREAETQAYINSLLKAQSDLHSTKHDMSNMLQVYDGYIQLDNMEALRGYHSSVMATVKRANAAVELLSALRERRALHTLLSIKIQRAGELNIKVGIGNAGYLADICLSDLDLCRLMGDLLDNAIDAAAISGEKYIEIQCRRPDSRNVQVEIANSTAGDVDIGRIFELGYTTKDGAHDGHGLVAAQNMLAFYEGCSMVVTYSNLRFCALLTFEAKPSG